MRERSIGHAWSDKEIPMRNQLKVCPHFIMGCSFHYGMLTMFEETPKKEECMKRRNFWIQSLQEQIKILDTDRSWNELLYKEVFTSSEKTQDSIRVWKLHVNSSHLDDVNFHLTSNQRIRNQRSVSSIYCVLQQNFFTVKISVNVK